MVEQLEKQLEALSQELEKQKDYIAYQSRTIDALEDSAEERARKDAKQTKLYSAAETALYNAMLEGKNTAHLFLQAIEALAAFTGDEWLPNEAREIIETVHGYALREPAAAEMAAEAAEHRLEMLERAYSQTDDSGEQKRIKAAIQSHQRRIAKLRKET